MDELSADEWKAAVLSISEAFDEFDLQRVKDEGEKLLEYKTAKDKAKLLEKLIEAADDFVNAFDKLCNGVPIYGGLASDGFSFSKYGVFDNDSFDMFGVVFLLISGNVKPIVACEYSISNENAFSAVVTKSEGNLIYELNKGKFVDVLKAEGLESGNTDVIMEFVGSPFTATLNMDDGNKIKVMRFLTILNQENRAGAFLGGVPEGSGLGIAIINKDDVEKSLQTCLEKMLEEMSKESDYEYSTFLLNSCGGRYLLLSRDHAAEARAYQAVLPKNISAAGFYTYGEMAPVTSADGEKSYNVFHNSTFTILAL